MPYRIPSVIALACLIALSLSLAARARQSSSIPSRHVQSDATPQAEPLAVLNDRKITLEDIDPRVRDVANRLDSEIEATRSRVLEDQLETLLFEAEAGKRRVSVNRLFEIEVTRRIADPTDEEIQAIYDANRAQFGSVDVTAARPQIVAYLRRESAQKLTTDLAARLRKRYVVVMGANVNSPNLARTATLATVAGRVIAAAPIIERLQPIIYDLRLRVYEAVAGAVERLISDLLVLEEARRKGVGPDVIIRKEITDPNCVTSKSAK